MYLNLIEIAESFGVPEKVIEDWIREQGLPHMRDRGRLLFDRAQVAHWAAGHGLTARAGFLAPDANARLASVALGPLLRAGGIWRAIPESGLIETLERIVEALPQVSAQVRALLGQRLRTVGGINWAPIGEGFALPHFGTRVTLGRGSGVVALILAQSAFSLPGESVDGVPVARLFFFIPPSPRAHLDILGRLSWAIRRDTFRERVKRAAPDAEILAALEEVDQAAPGGADPGGSRC